jgi:IS30 family transposase
MYSHLTRDRRAALAALLHAGVCQAAAARELGIHPATVSRELHRNQQDGRYHAAVANRLARERRQKAKVHERKIENDPALALRIVSRLHPLVSPEVIAHDEDVCHESIYAWIYRSRPDLTMQLPQRGRKRRRYGSKREHKQGWTKDIRSIHDRSPAAANRSRVGHFEGDTVRGVRETSAALLTLTDRKSRFEVAVKIPNEGCDAVHAVMLREQKRLGARSLTFDRGSCFALWQMIERHTGVRIYFADAHAPWQRPTNENTNGRLRRVFPKGTDFASVTEREVQRTVRLMNHTKRKCLSWRTPCEVWGRCCTSR